MKSNKYPSKEYLDECFIYDRETGTLVWRCRPVSHFFNKKCQKIMNKRMAGKVAGTIFTSNGKSYSVVSISNKRYYAHRVCYIIEHGCLPKEKEIDHIDGNGLNNSISNIRAVSELENRKNKRMHSNNSSGYSGVCFHSGAGKWYARIQINNKQISLGLYSSKDDAALAVHAARVKYKFHENHGKKRNL